MLRFILTFLVALAAVSCRDSEPRIDALDPAFGLLHGGETVKISGNNLEALLPAAIYLGSTRITLFKLHRPDELWITTPASEKEAVVDVRIIGSDGTEYLIENGFQYVRTADMAECVNISRQLNGKPVLERESKRAVQF